MQRRRHLPALAFALSLALLAAPAPAQDDDAEELEVVNVWGGVSTVLETDPEVEGAGQILGFLFNTDEGESFEVILDEMGRKLARECADRTDLVVEAEGVLAVDRSMITVRSFSLHFLAPDEAYEDDEEG